MSNEPRKNIISLWFSYAFSYGFPLIFRDHGRTLEWKDEPEISVATPSAPEQLPAIVEAQCLGQIDV